MQGEVQCDSGGAAASVPGRAMLTPPLCGPMRHSRRQHLFRQNWAPHCRAVPMYCICFLPGSEQPAPTTAPRYRRLPAVLPRRHLLQGQGHHVPQVPAWLHFHQWQRLLQPLVRTAGRQPVVVSTVQSSCRMCSCCGAKQTGQLALQQTGTCCTHASTAPPVLAALCRLLTCCLLPAMLAHSAARLALTPQTPARRLAPFAPRAISAPLWP